MLCWASVWLDSSSWVQHKVMMFTAWNIFAFLYSKEMNHEDFLIYSELRPKSQGKGLR